jgi:hypothetical protein
MILLFDSKQSAAAIADCLPSFWDGCNPVKATSRVLATDFSRSIAVFIGERRLLSLSELSQEDPRHSASLPTG